MSSAKLRKEKDCLNCGHVVEEHFCPRCGQENIVVKEDAFHMVIHAVADYFHFEHKFFSTIKPLLLKPGQLTAAYVSGKRVAFIHPIRLYIFVSIVFFLAVLSGMNREKSETESVKSNAKVTDTVTTNGLTADERETLEGIKEGFNFVPGMTKQKKDSVLRAAKAEIIKERKENNGKPKQGYSTKSGWIKQVLAKDSTVAVYEKRQASLPKDKRDGFIEHYFRKRTIELSKYPNPQEKLLEDFLHKIPKMMFFLLPLFAVILKLVYINKDRYYYEHLIYSFHTHSAMFLSILVTMLLQWIFSFIYDISVWLSLLCAIYLIWYIYRSLRTFYGSTRWITILKMIFLFFCYNIVLTICFLGVIAVSFAMI